MKRLWLKSKEKVADEIKATSFASGREETANAPANEAGQQMVTVMADTAQKGATLAYHGGEKLTKVGVDQLRAKAKERKAAEAVKNAQNTAATGASAKSAPARGTAVTRNARNTNAAQKTAKGATVRAAKTAHREAPARTSAHTAKTEKQGSKGDKTAQQAAAVAEQTQSAAQRTMQALRASAQAAAHQLRRAADAVLNGLKGAIAAFKGLIAAIAAGGWLAGVMILLICLIALVAGSAFGIFFGAESAGTGTSVREAVAQLNQEYQARLQEIADSVDHDRQEMESNDGAYAINWPDVLAVFASRVAGDEYGSQVAVLDEETLDSLREILWDMNEITYEVRTESQQIELSAEEGEDEEEPATVTVSETVLTITLTHMTTEEMAQEYAFTTRQNEYLDLMLEPGNQALWAELLGGFTDSGGQILSPDADWVATGSLQWPLPQTFTITSQFGYRQDPFTGEVSYHNGTDIAAPAGTPILAAASGTVTIANGIDPWGGSYGYHIKIDHGGGLETLYAHCSAICVTAGQQVQQGEVIGYVGTTGNSTGNHLHFEAWIGGQRVDAMSFFAAT